MKTCPFSGKPCIEKQCALFIVSDYVYSCAFVALPGEISKLLSQLEKLTD